jgi:hypothetical protein
LRVGGGRIQLRAQVSESAQPSNSTIDRCDFSCFGLKIGLILVGKDDRMRSAIRLKWRW